MSKFTPGPWEAPHIDDEVSARQFWVFGGNDEGLIAIVDSGKQEADTRLIAAAPEMYDTLKRIAEGCSFPADDVQRAIRDTARAVLAKVDG